MAVIHASEDERALIDAIHEIAVERVAPRAAEIDHTGEFPWDMKELLAQQDILAMPFPEEYGGLGSSELAIVMAIEELSRHCATTGLLLAVQQLGSMPILLAGNEEQKRKYFPTLASGEWMAAFALTEAGSGSDAAAMRTTAVRKGDKYILNGTKRFITNGGIARVTSVFVLTDPEQGTRGISGFIVEKDFPGFSVGRIEDKMGIKGSQTAELIFTDCEVPAENLLGREGEGFKIAMMTLDRTRKLWVLPRERSTWRSLMPSSASNSVSRLRKTRLSSSCLRIWRRRLKPRVCWFTTRQRWLISANRTLENIPPWPRCMPRTGLWK